MIRTQPSALILALLRYVESENEALAGDLAEEWRAGRSGRWFWRQLLSAIVVVSWRRREPRTQALHLVPTTPFDRPDHSLPLIDPATINLSGIKVRGIGGLGLLAIIMLITIVLPQAWFLVVAGLVGGGAIGTFMVLRRHDRGLSGSGGSRPLTLFGSPPDDGIGAIRADSRQSNTTRLVIVRS